VRTTLLLARAVSALPRAHGAAPWVGSSLSSVRYPLVLHPSWASLSRRPLCHCPAGMALAFVFTALPWSLPFLVGSARQLVLQGASSLGECDLEIQMDFVAHNGQNKCQTPSKEPREPREFLAGSGAGAWSGSTASCLARERRKLSGDLLMLHKHSWLAQGFVTWLANKL